MDLASLTAGTEHRSAPSEPTADASTPPRATGGHRDLTQLAPVGLFHADAAGRIDDVNPRLGRLLRCAKDGLLGDGWRDAIPAASRETVIEAWTRAVTERTPLTIDFPLDHPARETWLQLELVPAEEEPGFVGVVTDISRSKLAEQELQTFNDRLEEHVRLRTDMLTRVNKTMEEQIFARRRVFMNLERLEERWRSLVESAPDVILLVDRHGRIEYINHSQPRPNLGVEQITGRTVFDFVDAEHHAAAKADLERVFERAEMVIRVVTGPNDQGETRWFQSHMAPVQLDGKVIGATAIVRDVTNEHLADRQLKSLQDQLAHAARVGMIGEMTAQFCHEMGQPLFAISSYVSGCLIRLERDPGVDPEVVEVMRDAVAQSLSAMDVVKRLREFLQKQEAQRSRAEIAPIIADAVRLAESGIRRYGCRVVVDESPHPLTAIVDRIQIMQVLVNLLLNAAEAMSDHPSSERVVILATRPGVDDSVHFEVRDSGPGLPPGDPETLFEPFYSTKPKGLGLGLSICRSIIKAHGGRITAASNPAGSGACFLVELPGRPAALS